MRHSIDELTAFVAVVELNSFSVAAEKLCVTQPALSRRIAKIEADVGEQLLVRNRHNIQPTQIGRRFYTVAKRLVVEFQSADAEFRNIRTDDSGRVSISINMTWCSLMMPQLTGQFRAEFPNFTLNIHEGSGVQAVKKVYDGEVDIGVTHKPKRLFGVEFEALLSEEFVVASHRDHPLARMDKVPAAELKRHVWMRLLRDEVFSSLDWIEFDAAPNFPATLINANHYSTLLRLVDQNLGATVLPRMAISQFASDRIVLRGFAEPFLRRTGGILVKHGRTLSPAATYLAEIIRDSFAARTEVGKE